MQATYKIKTIALQQSKTNYSTIYPYDEVLDANIVLNSFLAHKQRPKRLFINNNSIKIPSYFWFVRTIHLLNTWLNESKNKNFYINSNNQTQIRQIINDFDLKACKQRANFLFNLYYSNIINPLTSWKVANEPYIIARAYLKDVMHYKKLDINALNSKDIKTFCVIIDGLNRHLIMLLDTILAIINDSLAKLTYTKLFYNDFANFINKYFANQAYKLKILENDEDFINTLTKNEELLPEPFKCNLAFTQTKRTHFKR